jgi:hypothetical protein
MNWYHNLKIILKQENKEQALDNQQADNESAAARTTTEIRCLILAHMK